MAKASQNEKEFGPFLNMIRGCGSVLEIGSRYGESLSRMADVSRYGAKVCSIDLPNVQTGRADAKPKLDWVITELNKQGYDASVFYGDSKSDEAIAFAASHGPFDVVFIDGDHSADGAYADWKNYGPMAAKYVVFHDIASTWPCANVWATVAREQPTVSFVDRTIAPDRRMGIGVIII